MALQDIPLQNSGLPHFRFDVDLDGATYLLEFVWNERTSVWFMNIYNASQELQAAGIRLVVGCPLASRQRYNKELPPGVLYAEDTSSADEDPGFEDLGTRVQLHYFPVQDLVDALG